MLLTKDTNTIYGFDLDTKKIIWSFDCDIKNVTEFTFYDGYLIFGMDNGALMLLSADTGEIKHQVDLEENIDGEIVIASNKLFVSTDKALYCFGNKKTTR